MYLTHFNLSERPFSITPDPRFLYMSARHREALAHLLYGLGEGGGFVQLTGEVGTGKTTICRCLLEQVPDNVDVALVFNPKVTAAELIASVCDELGISYPAETTSIKVLTDALNRHLLQNHANGRRTVLILDEAQNLSTEVLEQIRLLTNLETATEKLLQVILIGQPELRSILARDDMRQLAQRVTARYHLEPIELEDVGAYIQHRLQICGVSRNIFNKAAINSIQQLSGGIPRLINVLCDRALLGAYVEGKTQVDRKVVRKAAREVLSPEPVQSRSGSRAMIGFAVLCLLLLAYLWPMRETGLAIFQNATQDRIVPAVTPVDKNAPVAETTFDGGPSLAVLLDNIRPNHFFSAWRGLYRLWARELPEKLTADFCDIARVNGLQCLLDKGTWNNLRQFNRPVILKLAGSGGERLSVLLVSLDNDMAELVINGETHHLSVNEIDPYWYGNYSLLLQRPPAGTLVMRQGARHSDVAWLRKQLGLVLGVDLSSNDPIFFDEALFLHVQAFQRSQGLLSDGVVGSHTLIHLNTLSGQPGIPRLRQPAG
jgi:general secretion pathway protein A